MWYRYKVKDELGSIYRGIVQSESYYKAMQDIYSKYSNCNILDCTKITNSNKEK